MPERARYQQTSRNFNKILTRFAVGEGTRPSPRLGSCKPWVLFDSDRLTPTGVVRSISVGLGGHAILLAALISAAKGVVSEGFVVFYAGCE
jgi:hypothetical protein